ncbi:hypothetical protein Hdeb2414_s0380g00881151 [Helianthus debilis subsp. tardiflorus]
MINFWFCFAGVYVLDLVLLIFLENMPSIFRTCSAEVTVMEVVGG